MVSKEQAEANKLVDVGRKLVSEFEGERSVSMAIITKKVSAHIHKSRPSEKDILAILTYLEFCVFIDQIGD